MKRFLRYSLVGLACYLAFLVVLFPAAQAYRFAAEPLQKALPQLELGGLEGSVWNGRVDALVYRKAWLGEVHWQLSPLSLLLGKAQLKTLLQSREGYLQSRIRTPLGGGDIEMAEIEGRLPINELTRFVPYLPVVLGGLVSFDLPGLALSAEGRLLAAEGTVIWNQAAVRAPQALDFGDLQLVLHTEEQGRIVGEISDRGGPLKVEGTLELEPDGRYRVEAGVVAAADAPAPLKQSLGLLGRPDAQGRYRLNYNGKM